jgi:hypothetical protein
MKRDQIEEGKIILHSQGLGTVTEGMVRARARELALINGRSPEHLSSLDLEEAKRELMGEAAPPPEGLREDSLLESERWDPNSGSTGHQVDVVPAHDEQTDAEKLVDQGIEEAEHDQMVEGTRESLRRDT